MTRPPTLTSKELKRWSKLAAEALRACGEVRGPGGDLRSAADQARKTPIPRGELNNANPFVRMVKLSQRFVAATAAQRRELVADLRPVAEECAQALGGDLSPPSPPQLPFRADIDG